MRDCGPSGDFVAPADKNAAGRFDGLGQHGVAGLGEGPAVVFEELGLHGDDRNALGLFALQLREGQKFVQARLMRRNLGRGPELDFLFFQKAQRARFGVQIGAVKKQKILGVADHVEKIHAERSAVGDLGFARDPVFGVERLHGAYAEAFVGPEDVADAENQDVARFVNFQSGNVLHGLIK